MKSVLYPIAVCLAAVLGLGTERPIFAQDASKNPAPGAQNPAAIVLSELVAARPPTAFSHGSTIIQVGDTLICAWMGGEKDRATDVSILVSMNSGAGWSEPAELANGVHDRDRIRYPVWNPVFFQPRKGSLLLFYKEGPSPEKWWGMMKTSDDGGRSWTRAKKLPHGVYGPIRNKPVQLSNGTILCGSSVENNGWLVHVETVDPDLKWWDYSKPLNSSMEWGAIQPAIIPWDENTIEMLCRTKQGKVTQVWSYDKGKTWSQMRATELPNPNSAIDAVKLDDGTAVLVYNHSETNRGILNIATSKDGRRWQAAYVLENDPESEYSYPSVIQTADHLLHITYTAKKAAIKHVVVDPAKFAPEPFVEGAWPK